MFNSIGPVDRNATSPTLTRTDQIHNACCGTSYKSKLGELPQDPQGTLSRHFSRSPHSVRSSFYPCYAKCAIVLTRAPGSLLRRRQIQGSRPCAIATTHLLLQVVASSKFKAVTDLLNRIRDVGRRLHAAAPRELAVGNIVRRVLGLIREVTENPSSGEGDTVPNTAPPTPGPNHGLSFEQFTTSNSSAFSIATPAFELSSPPDYEANGSDAPSMKDVKDDVLNGMREMLDELDQADEQIAGYALEHIQANQTILTYTSSVTAQKFLLGAAKRRKFTVIQVEGYPNEHGSTFEATMHGKRKTETQDGDEKLKTLTAAGVTVIVVPDSAVFAVMCRVNMVLLPAQAVMSNGGFIAAAGTAVIAEAAKAHGVPVVGLGAVYKLSPLFPYNPSSVLDYGDSGEVLGYDNGELVDRVDVVNPIHDYIAPELVDLFITNIGAHAPSFMYRIVADHYRQEDIDL
ncbi:hypothetical protein FH972_025855 [Carpinus fangiana]|uniref:Translation initiation factor eIF2B subunit beta n=1 Tax=Carpinus fangiana TaxID=176857 RepID=A0A5N6L284_9ROSI|nr:hypothetical protein FH972_025855 [Carpinus fangiana]